ncbi:11142_t:CDS:2 [Funneliformis geosporum]|nr:11142_t:CDS:2 [Funneliformis geosporum]
MDAFISEQNLEIWISKSSFENEITTKEFVHVLFDRHGFVCINQKSHLLMECFHGKK